MHRGSRVSQLDNRHKRRAQHTDVVPAHDPERASVHPLRRNTMLHALRGEN